MQIFENGSKIVFENLRYVIFLEYDVIFRT